MIRLNLLIPDHVMTALAEYAKRESREVGHAVSKRAIATRLLAQALADELGDASLTVDLPEWGNAARFGEQQSDE